MLKRVLLAVSFGAVAFVLVSIVAVTWALTAESGTRWLHERAESRTSSWLSIGTVSGTLWRGLVLDDVVLQLDAAEARLTRVELSIDLARLLRGAVVLDELEIAEAAVRMSAAGPNGAREKELSLPSTVSIRRGSVQRLLVSSADDDIEMGTIRLSFSLEDDRVIVRDLSAEVLGFDVRGNGEVRLGPDLGIAAELDWSTTVDRLRWQGQGRIDGVLPTLQVQQELLTPVGASVQGEIELSDSPRADLSFEWSELAWPGLSIVNSPSGELRIAGWLDDYEFEADGLVEVEEVPARFSVSGSGTSAALFCDTLELSTSYGDIAARGEVAINPLTWHFDIEAQNIDPSVRFADWPGTLAGNGTIRGGLEPELHFTFTQARLDGVVREQAFTATGGVAFRAPGAWQLDAVSVEAGGNGISIDGRIGQGLNLNLVVDAPELGLLWPDATGVVAAEGVLSGALDALDLRLVVEGRDLKLGDYSVESIALAGDVSLLEDAPVDVEFRAEGAMWRNLVARSMVGSVSGSSTEHVLELDVESTFGFGRLRADGAWSGSVWGGRLTTLGLDQPSLGTWELIEPAAFEIGREFFRFDHACIERAGANLCGSARYGGDDERIAVTLSDFDLSALNVFFSDALSVTGLYDASLELIGPLREPTGSLSVNGGSTILSIREVAGPPLEIPIEELEIEVALAENALQIEAGVRGGAGASLTFDADLTDVRGDDPGLRANLTGLWTNLGVLSLLSPEVGEVGGTASLDLDFSGSLESPAVQGRVQWSEGRLAVPRWGFVIENIDVIGTSPDGTHLVFEATGRAGEGQIDVEGVTEFDARAGWPTRFSIRGESLQAVRLPDIEIFLSPDLEVQTAWPMIDVSGSVRIPRASLRLDEIPAQAVVPSSDTVVHGIDRPAPRRPLNVHADLSVYLGDEVSYSGAGLDAELLGEMQLVYDSGRNAIASGAVNLTGQYLTYGQTLELDRGQLLFTGPVGNPALDVRAVRRIDAITVGVQLGGTVNAPTTQIFSEPVMAEADALSYLVLGRPLSRSDDAESASLESAAVSLGLQQALPAIQRVGESLGLDELSVQTTDTDAGELMAGKQISSRAYVRYSYGLFNRMGGLLVRFRLNDRLSLETRSGDYKAMDLTYTVEKD